MSQKDCQGQLFIYEVDDAHEFNVSRFAIDLMLDGLQTCQALMIDC